MPPTILPSDLRHLQTMGGAGVTVAELTRAISAQNEDTGWITPTLENSWKAFGGEYAAPGYRKMGNTVRFRGLLGGFGAAGTQLFILPKAFFPAARLIESVASGTGAAPAPGWVRVAALGGVAVSYSGSPEAISLDGVTFTTD
jgi:hypothetical protein